MDNLPPPIAVLGTYRSGTSAIAGVLHHLGVDMGAPFWGQHFESAELAHALRRWWNEPKLVASISAALRKRHLKAWLVSRQQTCQLVGAKHPLLSLCGQDVLHAWGEDVRLSGVSAPSRNRSSRSRK